MGGVALFSNGTEYEAFLSCQCHRCPHFVYWEEATAEHPECDIEARIALAGIEYFPYEWLDGNDNMHRYDCRKKSGLETKNMNTD